MGKRARSAASCLLPSARRGFPFIGLARPYLVVPASAAAAIACSRGAPARCSQFDGEEFVPFEPDASSKIDRERSSRCAPRSARSPMLVVRRSRRGRGALRWTSGCAITGEPSHRGAARGPRRVARRERSCSGAAGELWRTEEQRPTASGHLGHRANRPSSARAGQPRADVRGARLRRRRDGRERRRRHRPSAPSEPIFYSAGGRAEPARLAGASAAGNGRTCAANARES